MQKEFIDRLIDDALRGEGISQADALRLETLTHDELDYLFEGTNKIRDRFKGQDVKICSIVNAKSGRCVEDCSFCAQSSQFNTDSPEYELMSVDEIVAAPRKPRHLVPTNFPLSPQELRWTTGRSWTKSSKRLRRIKAETSLETCCSMGLMSREHLQELKAAGLDRCHHNLETAASHFKNIVTTHTYEDEVRAVENAKQAGLQVCVGGVFGMGETFAQRVELALDIKALGTQSLPINFLKPIEGTGWNIWGSWIHTKHLEPLRCSGWFCRKLTCSSVVGREEIFNDQQDKLFQAGANGILGGNYLTTKGQDPKKDLEMIEGLGLKPVFQTI